MLEIMGCLDEFKINRTKHTFTHIYNKNQILCKGLDGPEKIKSIKNISGMWVEETTEFSDEEISQLSLRIRGEKEFYVQFIYSFNPISEDNPIVKRFVTCSIKPPKTKVVHSTYHNNFFLTDQDREELENLKHTNPLYYDIYCLGIPGIVDKSGKFLYSFRNEQVQPGLKINPNLPLWLTFDFNIDPMTVTAAQREHVRKLTCFDNIQLNDSDIYAMCDRIKAEYGQYHLIVTGDASGHNRTGTTRGKTSYWKVIRDELQLKNTQIMVRSQNLGLIESRVLCNSVNKTMEIVFSDKCEQLINDCKFAKVDDQGELIKDRKKQKNDFLDGFRYLLDANWPDILDKPKKYQ